MDVNKLEKIKNKKKLVLYVGAYTSASILGPLLIFGTIGFILDRQFNTRPWLLILSVFIAFIVTNIFLYRKLIAINQLMNKFNKKSPSETNEEEN